ncbi:MAG: alpha-galactosidase [Phycisphaerae bacterium]|nr:alpha-galactosidase [Phycisphaerae bacterium]
MLAFEESSGAIKLTGSFFSSDNGTLSVKLADTTCYANRLHFTPCGDSKFKATDRTIDLQVILDDRMFILNIKNISGETIRVDEVFFDFAPSTFNPPLQARDYRQLIHSRDFETVSHIKPVHLPGEFNDDDPESGMMTVFSNDTTRHALLIGTLPPYSDAFCYISARHESLHKEGLFGLRIRFEFRRDLAPGMELSTSPLVMIEGMRGGETLEKYGQMVRNRLMRSPKPVVTGWNTWDYYAGAITRRDMDENIATLKKVFGQKIKYIILDEGWECLWGVWQANWKFPEGLEELCRRIKADGYIPGIWTAPLMVSYFTPLYRNHPDWFVSHADGNVHLTTLSYGTMAQLDITVPAVQDHLRRIYTTLKQNGFEYFKVDFTQMIMDAERFHDTQIGRAKIVRKVFRIIRESIGEESYLLSCGGPFESVIGIADACRISTDIHNYWSMIAQNIRCFLSRLWMQGTIGNIDPDFLIVRSRETTEDPMLNRRLPIRPRAKGKHWNDGAEMTAEEAKVLALAVYLIGGEMILGDAVGKLNAEGLAILKKVIEPLATPARTMNLFDPRGQSYPILWAKRENDDLVGFFNLTDEMMMQQIDLAFLDRRFPANAIDFWSGRIVSTDRCFQLSLPPRSARGLIFPHAD